MKRTADNDNFGLLLRLGGQALRDERKIQNYSSTNDDERQRDDGKGQTPRANLVFKKIGV